MSVVTKTSFVPKVLILSALLFCFPVIANDPCHPFLDAFTTGWLKIEKAEPIRIQPKSQIEIAKTAALTYPLTLPKKIQDRTLHALKMGDYHLLDSDPKNFSILDVNIARNTPENVHSLSFTNSSHAYSDVIKVDYGMCMGHSSAQRKFNILSFFDPKNKAAQLVPDKERDLEAWYKFYEDKITLLLEKNQPVVIPGFKNLESFSSEPRLQRHMKKLIVKLWSDKNISLGGLSILNSVAEETNINKAVELHKKVKNRLARHFSPNLYLAAPNDGKFAKGQWIHVMQAYKIEEMQKDGSYVIHVWDVNNRGSRAASELIVDATGGMTYNGQKMAKVDQVPWDDHEIGEITKNLLKFCERNPALCPKRTP